MTEHHDLLVAPLLGHATTCVGYGRHTPRPLRYVWHHVLPKACGGQTVSDNLVSLCDLCHYAVHALMYEARLHGVVPGVGSRGQRAIALRGYQAAQAAGTVDQLPDLGVTDLGA